MPDRRRRNWMALKLVWTLVALTFIVTIAFSGMFIGIGEPFPDYRAYLLDGLRTAKWVAVISTILVSLICLAQGAILMAAIGPSRLIAISDAIVSSLVRSLWIPLILAVLWIPWRLATPFGDPAMGVNTIPPRRILLIQILGSPYWGLVLPFVTLAFIAIRLPRFYVPDELCRCGYHLGGVSGVCPECGEPIDDPTPAEG